MTSGIGRTCVQLEPPLKLTPTTWPLAPPFDHRSACHIPTMLAALVGLTSIQGSTSLSGKTLASGAPDSNCSGTLSAVQPANGLVSGDLNERAGGERSRSG